MVDILKQVIKKRGVVKNIKIPGINKIVFRHVEKDGNLHNCIQNTLQKRDFERYIFIMFGTVN
jgi:hypothetical protein